MLFRKLIKTVNHLDRLRRHRNGTVYVVCGYPRSGTTMLSELISICTDFYFDRNNIFPASGTPILHTHWDPARFRRDYSVCIVRNPEKVAISLISYWRGRNWGEIQRDLLRNRRTCRFSWLQYLRRAEDSEKLIVDYDNLLGRNIAAFERLANHLDIPTEWLLQASELLQRRHEVRPNHTDVKYRQLKENWLETRHRGHYERIRAMIQPEIEYYKRQYGGED